MSCGFSGRRWSSSCSSRFASSGFGEDELREHVGCRTRSCHEGGRTMIRVGVGGWTFAPWRGSFYPEGLPAKRELEYASRHLTSIEINGTFYRSQGPKSFAKWREETPEDFVYTVKGHRAVVNAKALG